MKCLNGAYDVEPGDGESRDNHLKMMNIKTYLIKRTEPLRTRKICSIVNENRDEQLKKYVDPKYNQNNCVNSSHNHNNNHHHMNGSQLLKRLSKSAINEEEQTTDWTPEIPFKNVRV